MKIARFSVQSEVKYGVIENDIVRGFQGSPFSPEDGFTADGSSYKLSDVKLLAPCEPSKLVCLGLNYRSHAEETNSPLPQVPLLFLKPSTAVISPDDTIIKPDLPDKKRIDYECEVGVVIGKIAKDVPEKKALDYVLGYTCANDVTARDIQQFDVQWTRAKSFDTFAPIGPCIQTEATHDNLKVETYVNGELKQSGNTNDLIFNIPQLISFISGIMTLLPGDIISTGTPSGIGPINHGDVVEIVVEKVGTLRNPVADKS
jgi:2-keto-4-pentenoate hydratase/2-oxohepta-3-ene-1,7-dioic acid hydratase in catechol pathway